MDQAERWSRVSEILSRALDLPDAQRTQFLAETVRSEPALRTEILAMSEELRNAGEFLEHPPLARLDVASSFGPYRVVGELGEGGMGVVYLAERDDGQFTRRVAIKLIGGTSAGSEIQRRFREERRILASLDHPNIARLIDAGITDAGVPYLVMEHVEGPPITEYCRERGLELRQRLELFVKVCGAIRHAHQRLVVHRDLKPANILVDTAGEPKLLDFGIAKLLAPHGPGESTQTVNRALTLDYASPEQLRGEAVSTVSDVYSLGVVLYELLARAKPYECDPRALSDAVRLVCEFDPPPPSASCPPALLAALAGDLDAIAMKALEKASADRYGSVAELAEDVGAHLAHRPVRARRASFVYVLQKFARRHRAGVAAASLAFLLIAVSVSAVVWQVQVTERERQRAQQRFDEVRRLANYVIFDLQDGVGKLTGSTELRHEMVEESLAYLDSLAADAKGDAALVRELAGAYQRLGDVQGLANTANLGDKAGAVQSFRKGRDLLRQSASADPSDHETRRALGRVLMRLSTAHQLDRSDLAIAPLQEARSIWLQLASEAPEDEENLRGLAAVHYGTYLSLVPDMAAAVPHLEDALAIHERLLAASPQDLDRKRSVAVCHKTLSGSLLGLEDLERARSHALRAAALDAERMAAEPDNAQAQLEYTFDLSALGDVELYRGDFVEALVCFEEALAVRRELWAADRRNAYAGVRLVYMLARVGESRVLAGQFAQARTPLREAISLAAELESQQAQLAPILVRAFLYRGELERVSGGNPCPWYAQMKQLLDAGSVVLGSWFVPAAVPLRDGALRLLESCPAPGPRRQAPLLG